MHVDTAKPIWGLDVKKSVHFDEDLRVKNIVDDFKDKV